MRTRDGRRRDEGRTVGTPEERQAMSGPAPGQARPAGRQPIDPRFRRRRVEARRAEGRRRLRALLAGLSVAALAGLATGLLYSPLLRVRDVVVVGDVHTPRAAVLAAAGLSVPGRVPMLDAGSASEVRAVEALPWVARASFTKRWPWTVVVSVHERRPVAVVADGAGQALVDGSGRVLEAGRRLAGVVPLPFVAGAVGALPGGQVRPSGGTSPAALSELLAAAGACPAALARRGVELEMASTGVEARLGGTATLVVLGSPASVGEKLAVLEELERAVDVASYSVVDLSVPQRPALTPRVN